MNKEYKINFFKDKKDYEKNVTNDEIINIIGSKGSGKTTASLKYMNNEDYIVINLDKLFELPGGIEHKELSKIRDILKKKYTAIKDGKEFYKQYIDIINYIKKENKKGLIEGNTIQDITPITKLRGKVIVKRTAKIKSFIRAVKRDYKNEYFMKLEIEKHGKLGKLTRFLKIVKRRKKIFKQCNDIENVIKKLEKVNT